NAGARNGQSMCQGLRDLRCQTEGTHRIPPPFGRGEKKGPSKTGQGAGTLYLFTTGRPGASPMASQRRSPSGTPGTVFEKGAEKGGLRNGGYPAHRPEGTLRDLGALCQVWGGQFSAHPYPQGG